MKRGALRSQGAPAGRAEGRRAIAAVILVLGCVVFANLIATRVSSRFDLTEDHVYTLSPASRALVRSLPDELTVKAYISRDLPPALDAVAHYARELLEEYRLASEGKLRVQVLDPTTDSKIEEQAGRCRIGKTAVEVRNTSKREVSQHTLGLCLWYDGKSRALAPIDGTAGLEYQISALIKTMSQRRRKAAFTAGRGERDLGQDYSFVRHALEQELDVITLDPSSHSIGEDVDLLVVAGPRRPFVDQARRAIDAFLMTGRPALFLIDGAQLDTARADEAPLRRGRPIDSGLQPLLDAYGFHIGDGFVFDRINVPGPVDPGDSPPARGGPLSINPPAFVNLPAFVAARPDRASSSSELSITAGIDAVVFPFASSVQLVGPLARGDSSAGRVWTLARTSPGAWQQAGPFPMSTGGPAAPPAATESFALAYAYQGILTSAYPPAVPIGRPPVVAPGGDDPRRSARPVRLVIAGGSDFVSDRYMELLRSFPIYAGGAQLLLNAVSWALEDDALTVLRGNVLKARPLRIDPAGQGGGADLVALLTWGNVVGLPLAICAAGLLRWRWRSTTRRRQTLTDPRGGRS